MSDPRHERACEIFNDVCDLPPREREEALERVCGGDPELRSAVRALLSGDAHGASVLPSAAPGAGAEGPAVPERIGRYRCLRRIGAGGRGVVYEAEQESPRRRVAVKVLASSFAGEEVRRRFEHEAQVLGRLKHPGIAAVYEAGTFDAGSGPQPFLAMELVEGRPLLRHAEEAGLDRRARVELLVRICEAVEHAHGKGVVHRDLKPGNILVEAAGQPKILDFGVARASGADLRASTLATRTGDLLGTLPYMSPEQVGGDPSLLDARSDVYALGVIAFELLAGRLPYDVARWTVAEASRAILEEEPTRLSSVDRSLAGDLDTVVAKALEKEKERRYASAEDLASDLRRFLRDEPVRARPPSLAYQVAKFARRNRRLTAALAAIVVTSVAGGVVGLALHFQSRANFWRAEKAEGEWRDAAQRAQRKALFAERVTQFVSDLFQVSDPSGQRGAEVKAIELLERGRGALLSGLEEEPELRAALMRTVGRVEHNLGKFEAAKGDLERAVALLRETPGSDPLELATCLFGIGEAEHYLRRTAEARPFYEEALALRRRHLPPDDPELARSLDILARLHRDEGDLARGRALALEAGDMRERNPSTSRLDRSESLQTLASLAYFEGRVEEAEDLFTRCQTMREEGGAALAFRVPEILHSRARVASARDDRPGAEKLLLESCRRAEAVFGPRHPFSAYGFVTLADLYVDQRRFEEAEARLDDAEAVLGPESPLRANVLLSRATLYSRTGRSADAERAYEGAVSAFDGARDDLAAAVARSSLAVHRMQGRKFAEAEAPLRESAEILAARYPTYPERPRVVANLALCLLEIGRFEEAERLGLEAVEVARVVYGAESPLAARTVERFARLYTRVGGEERAAGWRARLPR